MKEKNLLITVIITILMIGIIFIVYYTCNVVPKEKKIEFNKIESKDIIKEFEIQNKKVRTAIYYTLNSEIFKQYNFHSYVSGDGTGRKIYLETYIISKDKEKCYKIKTNCYDYQDPKRLKFLGYYYNFFIDKRKEYNIAVYIPDNDILYITNIEI